MSHGTDPSRLPGDDRSPSEGTTPHRLVERFVSHFAAWPRRYVETQVEALDPER